MMNKDRVYMDSCCFIDMIKIKTGRLDLGITEARKKDAWFLRRLCDASIKKEIQIITSTLTVAECYQLGEGYIDDRAKDLFTRFLTSGRVVDLVSLEIFIAERARDLFWKDNIRLKGADAVHVASALIMECKEFITTDDRILKPRFNAAIPDIERLGLSVIHASDTTILPTAYRQDNLIEENLEEETQRATTEEEP